MSESIQAAVDLLTAAAAFGAFGVSLWNAYQFSVAQGPRHRAGRQHAGTR